MSQRVVHLVPTLSRGGAGRALLSAATAAGAPATVVSLRPADPLMGSRVRAAGLELVEAPSPARLSATLETAEAVVVHFWNDPELFALRRQGLPPVHLALWVHVAGDAPPHVLSAELAALADAAVVTSARSGSLASFREPPVLIAAAPDPARIASAAVAHEGFVVGYVGALDFAKLHPRFVELCAAVEVPAARFVVCGSGAAQRPLVARARALGLASRFELRGYVEDVAPVLAGLDVFGYPLAAGTYSTSDLALQEAMASGVPPVVLPHGATAALVEHGVTGLVARDADEYPRLVARLERDPSERLRLGRAARARFAARGPKDVAAARAEVLAGLAATPKRPRALSPLAPGRFPGAGALVASLDGTVPELDAGLAEHGAGSAPEAQERVLAASPGLAAVVLDYRRCYPEDGLLRLWSGLALDGAGRHVLAAAEYKRAAELGCGSPSAERYLTRAAARAAAGSRQ